MTADIADETVRAGTPLTQIEARQRGGPRGERGRRLARPLRRAPEWLVTLGVGVLQALLCAIPQWRGTSLNYVGDLFEQFAPMWHLFGRQLRDGNWPTMDPAGWTGGNYAAEALTGIWNPVNWANFLLTSSFDNLTLAAFLVLVEFLSLLAMGTYLLAREYGAGRAAAVVVATAVPVSGFTLWFEASGWPAGLMAFTWVTYFWWSARRHARGRLNPFVPFLFGALAMTTGNPYAALGLAVVVAALGVELLLQRRYARLAHLLVMGACVGALALLIFLPLVGTNPVSARQTLAGVANDTFLVPDVGDLAASSAPTYLPAILSFSGQPLERVPATYFAWFVLPLLPWLRWSALRGRIRSLVSVCAVAGVYLLATLGPSNLWLFRWPVRLIEYLYLAVAVLFAVALSAGPAGDRVRRRAAASGAIVVVGAYLAWAVRPAGLNTIHLAGFLLVTVLVALAVGAGLRRGTAALGAVVVAGTALVATLQTVAFPQFPASSGDVPPYVISEAAAGASEYRGTVLQLAALPGVTTEDVRSGRILFGNLPRGVGIDAINNYSGIGFLEFGTELCMDYRGATCPEAFDRLWQPTGDSVPVPLVDALRVSTLVLQRTLLPAVVDQTPPEGWRVAERTPVRAVWVREHPVENEGRVSWTSPGVELQGDDSEPQRETVRYRAEAPGRILFARLAWPGYAATVDGEAVDVVNGPAGLVVAKVPAGEGTLVLTHRQPGLRLGVAAGAAAAMVVLAQTVLWLVQSRRSRIRARTVREGTPQG